MVSACTHAHTQGKTHAAAAAAAATILKAKLLRTQGTACMMDDTSVAVTRRTWRQAVCEARSRVGKTHYRLSGLGAHVRSLHHASHVAEKYKKGRKNKTQTIDGHIRWRSL